MRAYNPEHSDELYFDSSIKEEDNYSNPNEEEMIKLFNELINFVPSSDPNVIEYVRDILKFAESMVHGDAINQYFTSNGSLSHYASIGLEKVMSSVQAKALEKYKREKSELETSLEALRQERSSLSVEIPALQGMKKSLENDVGNLNNLKKELEDEIQKQKASAIQDLEKQVATEKASLSEEIRKLMAEKANLESTIKSYEKSLEEYYKVPDNKPTTDDDNSQGEVVWETVKYGDPLYDVTFNTWQQYIDTLKQKYLTGESEIAVRDRLSKFNLLYKYLDRITNYNFDYRYYSISQLLDLYDRNVLSVEFSRYLWYLKDIMESINVPHFVQKKQEDTLKELTRDDLPLNVSYAVRELNIRKEMLKAKAEKRILEEQLRTSIGLLARYVPEEIDLSLLLDHKENNLQEEKKHTL